MTIGSLDDDDDHDDDVVVIVILLYATGELCTSWMGICCLDQTPDSSLKLSLNKKCAVHFTLLMTVSPPLSPFHSAAALLTPLSMSLP